MAHIAQPPGEESIREATHKEAYAAFDYTCRYYLDVSAEQFLKEYDAGKIVPNGDFRVKRVLDLLPLLR